MLLALQFFIYFIGLFLVYRTGLKRGYELGYKEALTLRIVEFMRAAPDEKDPGN